MGASCRGYVYKRRKTINLDIPETYYERKKMQGVAALRSILNIVLDEYGRKGHSSTRLYPPKGVDAREYVKTGS